MFFFFSPVFKSLESNSSLVELTVDPKEPLDDVEVQSLVEMLQANTTLVDFNLAGSGLNMLHFKKIVKMLEHNTALRQVHFPSLNLSCLIFILKCYSTKNPKFYIDFAPHFIDLTHGFIYYYNKVESSDLAILLEALQSNVPINRIECLGVFNLSLSGLLAAFEILAFNKTVIDIDCSPHVIDIDNGLFCYSPLWYVVSVDELSTLSTFIETHSIKQLVLKHCHFTDGSVSVLFDLISVNSSLTSVDFSYCGLSDDNIFVIIAALQSNNSSNIMKLNLSNNSISSAGANALTEVLKNFPRISVFNLRGNPIDSSTQQSSELEFGTRITF
ncbi:hypothetical protein GEMRC1_006094 [Eukaryota sp. GEM-RC1]